MPLRVNESIRVDKIVVGHNFRIYLLAVFFSVVVHVRIQRLSLEIDKKVLQELRRRSVFVEWKLKEPMVENVELT
jgi:hypothetical protein